MKVTMTALALSFAAFAATAPAHAANAVDANAAHYTAQQTQDWSAIQTAPKTRAQVRAELVRAQHDGELAAVKDLYRGG
jgi:hypothetical protein